MRKYVEIWPHIPKNDSVFKQAEKKKKKKSTKILINFKSEIHGQSKLFNTTNFEFVFLISQYK